MKESDIEKHLTREVKKYGGIAMKFVSPGLKGVPDRLVCLPGGNIVFIELKAPGQKPRKQQQYRIKQLRELGFTVKVMDSKDQIDKFLDGPWL